MNIKGYTFTENNRNEMHPDGIYISYSHNLPYKCLDRIVTVDGEWHGVIANWNGESEMHPIDIDSYIDKCENIAKMLGREINK